MKKFKYAIGIAAMALFGACSSEIPVDVPSDVDNGEESMHIAIKFDTNSATRATASQKDDKEGKINSLQLIILNEEGNEYLNKTIDDPTALASGIATFKISNAKYEDMVAKQQRGAKMKVLVYVNGSDVNPTSYLTGATTDPTWGIQTWEGVKSTGFIMSNAEDVEGFGSLTTSDGSTAADGSADKPWCINANVKLNRLCCRFDYNKNPEDGYQATLTAEKQSCVTFDNIEFAINTFANTTYRIAHFSEDGNVPYTSDNKTIDVANWSNYESTGTHTYRVTDSFKGGENNIEFPTYKQHHYVLTSSQDFTYKRPNTTSKNTFLKDKTTYYTLAEVLSNPEMFKKIPYACVKAQFHVNDYAGTGQASPSMAANEAVFVVDGYFIGGVKDIRLLKSKGYDGVTKKFTLPATVEIGNSLKKQIEDNVNEVLALRFPSDIAENAETLNTDEKKLTADENWLQKNLGGAEKYEVTKNEAGVAIGYFSYYAALITHDATKSNDLANYFGISRNHVYSLLVNSIKLLGNSGGDHPGEGPAESDLTEMNISLKVKINPWELVLNKFDL